MVFCATNAPPFSIATGVVNLLSSQAISAEFTCEAVRPIHAIFALESFGFAL
jgi:hypothetical protein